MGTGERDFNREKAEYADDFQCPKCKLFYRKHELLAKKKQGFLCPECMVTVINGCDSI